MSNVVTLPVVTTLDVPPSRVLADAMSANLDQAIVIGRNQDGTLYFASSVSDGAEANWLLDAAKFGLFQAANVIP